MPARRRDGGTAFSQTIAGTSNLPYRDEAVQGRKTAPLTYLRLSTYQGIASLIPSRTVCDGW